MTVEEMKQRKKELGYSNEKLSELSGVPLGTVQKVLAGVTRSPRYETLIALEREYWLVDPKGKKVIVYDFEAEVTPSIYGFSSKVPVGIFKGGCEVDFAKIYEYISFLYEEDDV